MVVFLILINSVGICGDRHQNIVIVSPRQSDPYLRCEKGIRRAFQEGWPNQFEITTFYMNDYKRLDELSYDISRMRPTLGFAIGTKAAYFFNKTRPVFPLVVTFVIDKTIKHLHLDPLLAVSLDVPLQKKLDIFCQIEKKLLAGILKNDLNQVQAMRIKGKYCREKEAFLVLQPFRYSIENALHALLREKINGFIITPDPAIYSNKEVVKYTLLWGLRNKIAICGLSSGYVKNGALFSLEADLFQMGYQAGRLGIRFLTNQLSGPEVIEHPMNLILSLNLKTARRLNLEIPERLIDSATLVIE